MTKALNFKNKIKNGRDLAIQVVYLCEQEDMYSHVAWSQSLYGRDFDQREKKFAMVGARYSEEKGHSRLRDTAGIPRGKRLT